MLHYLRLISIVVLFEAHSMPARGADDQLSVDLILLSVAIKLTSKEGMLEIAGTVINNAGFNCPHPKSVIFGEELIHRLFESIYDKRIPDVRDSKFGLYSVQCGETLEDTDPSEYLILFGAGLGSFAPTKAMAWRYVTPKGAYDFIPCFTGGPIDSDCLPKKPLAASTRSTGARMPPRQNTAKAPEFPTGLAGELELVSLPPDKNGQLVELIQYAGLPCEKVTKNFMGFVKWGDSIWPIMDAEADFIFYKVSCESDSSPEKPLEYAVIYSDMVVDPEIESWQPWRYVAPWGEHDFLKCFEWGRVYFDCLPKKPFTKSIPFSLYR